VPDFVLPAKNNASPFADMRGHHVAVRTSSLAEAKDFYVGKLDFRVVAEWDYADEQLAYLAPPTDDHFYIEVLGGGNTLPTEVRPYTDLGDSLGRHEIQALRYEMGLDHNRPDHLKLVEQSIDHLAWQHTGSQATRNRTRH
jgi:catechol 2,3-dioxygenase-like lactoylglutathione lyase family enzyme